MQPTNQLLGVQFRARIRLVTNAVSYETLLFSDFLSHHIKIQLKYIIIAPIKLRINIDFGKDTPSFKGAWNS